MTSEQFVYWLQGFLEIAQPKGLTEKQIQIIQDHLGQVFDKQTPDRIEYIPTPIYQPFSPPSTPETPTIICETTSSLPSDSSTPSKRQDSRNKRIYC